MTGMDGQALAARFSQMSDDELQRRYRSGDMTPQAREVAGEELRQRGLLRDEREEDDAHRGIDAGDSGRVADDEGLGDVICLVRLHDLMEAQVLCARLEAEGIPAVAGDAELIRANSFLRQALGGIRIMVHEANAERARQVWEALKRGDYALDEGDEDDEATLASPD